ncbi:MAG: STM3941 family protein [Salegentibacter sp.]
MEKEIEIPLSKTKVFLLFIGSLLFVIGGITIFYNTDEFREMPLVFLRNPLLIKGIGILGVLFFGGTGFIAIKKLLGTKVGLIISKTGITDNSNALNVGLIEWRDISEIRQKRVMATKFLLIDLVDPEKYIERSKSGMKAGLMRANMKAYGTPLSITSNSLKCDFGKLESLLQAGLKENLSATKL